jgi:hypothetical protein
MSNTDPKMDMAGVTFFGTISAAVTHDMKNFIAIINENAGLLGDLAARARHGAVPVDPEKAGLISEKIQKQVGRADAMMKQFNRFSHSMDRAQDTVDMEETVLLVSGLAERILRHHGVNLTVTSAPAPCRVQACRFDLLHLIFRAMTTVCEIARQKSDNTRTLVTVCFNTAPGKTGICFVLEPDLPFDFKLLFDAPADRTLLARVNMHIEKTFAGNGFCLCTTRPEK